MGNPNWDAAKYRGYSSSVKSKSSREIFTNTSGCHEDLDPAKIKIRESVDSEANPESTPVIVCVDETGSMGHLATEIIKRSLGVIVQGIYDRKPVTDPHILLAAVGDMYCDSAPLQVTQFEADVSITEQIEKFYIEGNGGANNGESYPAIWWFAQNKTVCDSINKRGRRGYIFTIGDECPLPMILKEHIKRFMDVDIQSDIKIEDLLKDVQDKWHVFHLITPTTATEHQGAIKRWRELLGQQTIIVPDHEKLGEIIVSTMQVNEGENLDAVCDGWDGITGLAVRDAVSDLASKSNEKRSAEIVNV